MPAQRLKASTISVEKNIEKIPCGRNLNKKLSTDKKSNAKQLPKNKETFLSPLQDNKTIENAKMVSFRIIIDFFIVIFVAERAFYMQIE